MSMWAGDSDSACEDALIRCLIDFRAIKKYLMKLWLFTVINCLFFKGYFRPNFYLEF